MLFIIAMIVFLAYIFHGAVLLDSYYGEYLRNRGPDQRKAILQKLYEIYQSGMLPMGSEVELLTNIYYLGGNIDEIKGLVIYEDSFKPERRYIQWGADLVERFGHLVRPKVISKEKKDILENLAKLYLLENTKIPAKMKANIFYHVSKLGGEFRLIEGQKKLLQISSGSSREDMLEAWAFTQIFLDKTIKKLYSLGEWENT